ncbi:hypothetical protein FI667_g8034, partial [Globisporangium splendens]
MEAQARVDLARTALPHGLCRDVPHADDCVAGKHIGRRGYGAIRTVTKPHALWYDRLQHHPQRTPRSAHRARSRRHRPLVAVLHASDTQPVELWRRPQRVRAREQPSRHGIAANCTQQELSALVNGSDTDNGFADSKSVTLDSPSAANASRCHRFIFQHLEELKYDHTAWIGVCHTDQILHQSYWNGGPFHTEFQTSQCKACAMTDWSYGALLQQFYISGPSGIVHFAGDAIFLHAHGSLGPVACAERDPRYYFGQPHRRHLAEADERG